MYARNKTRQLFGQEDHGIEFGKYGLGPVRTLKDYEIFGGFDFKNCRIQTYTLNVETPPNPGNYEKQFTMRENNVVCKWDLEFFKKQKFTSPNLLTLGICRHDNKEIYRKDFELPKDPDYVHLLSNEYVAKFSSIDEPKKIVMYYRDDNKGWSERYEQQL